jgi:glycosyltransferase involved in cell wall biosynthesis
VGELGVPDDRRWLLPPGANIDLIHPLRKHEARRRFNLPAAAHIVVSTGYAPYDEQLLADSMAEVLAADPDAWAVTSGGKSPVLQRTVGERLLETRLRMLGSVPLEELEWVLACADVLLLPYSNRPVNRARFPNRFGDFLAAGRPIVTNRTGDLGDLVALHEIGLLAEDDPVDMARKAVGLLQDVRAAEELGRRARAFAESNLSWEKLARGVEGFYGTLVGNGSRSTSSSR